ncbi:MAG: chemotaxis protein CheW [Thermodesulfobacteriota bacterium]
MNKQRKRTVGQGRFLTFSLGGDTFGLGIFKVKAVVELMTVICVPGFSLSMEGVINYRGKFLPVVDIRQKFNMHHDRYTEKTCILVVEVQASKGVVSEVGIIVDAVSEVVNISRKTAKLRLPLAKKETTAPF